MPPRSRPVGFGTPRLFCKFQLVLLPAFLLSAALGLSLVADRMAQNAYDQLSARIGAHSGHLVAALSRQNLQADRTAGQDLLSTLLHDPAILCAEVSSKGATMPILTAPKGLGCIGQRDDERFQLPIGQDGHKTLHVRFSTHEVEATRQSYREFSILALVIGLLVSAAASYVSFRMFIANPLGKLLFAIRQSREKAQPVYADAAGRDELSTVVRAYNDMQKNLDEESQHVLQKSRELTAERRKREELLSKTFQIGPYPFAILDPATGVYTDVNEAWLRVMKYDRQDVIGKSAESLEIWVDLERRSQFVEQLKGQGSVRAFEANVRTKSGEILTTLMSGEFVELDDGPRLFMVADDVTELRDAEAEKQRNHEAILDAKAELEETNTKLVQQTRELEAAQESLVQQERLATLGELTATVSHELRNPLAAIRSSIHLATQKAKGSEIGIERSLERAERNIVRCDGIISDLLGYASEPKAELQEILADDWLLETLKDQETGKTVEIVYELAAPGVELLVMPERIRQAVVNIFENAVQAMADVPAESAKLFKVSTSASSKNYKMVFEDSGLGIDADNISNVFEPLFSTKSYGTGLGLATTKKIIEKHLGSIELKSDRGIGTKVTIQLPLKALKANAA
ncbi:MAG: PAS domain-containing protein [Alphaproteobacteria bacterium]|nr:PAS domain-containing protein [Alphaproteobacteria bacterium]